MSVNNGVTIKDLTAEQITDVEKRIETFVKSNEFFDKLCAHKKVKKGNRTWQFRRLVRPKVKPEDVHAYEEGVAPRPTGLAVETFEKTVNIYRDKFVYTAEDTLYGFDDIVKAGGDTLADIVTQKADIIKGKPFFTSRAVAEYPNSGNHKIEEVLDKGAIMFGRQNHAKKWNGAKYLALMTPEILKAFKAELRLYSDGLSEPSKEQLDRGIVGSWGRWELMECPSDLAIGKDGSNNEVHYLIMLARRPNGESPVEVTVMDNIQVIHNPLGSGMMVDEDGNLTSDDNKQKGSIAVNVGPLGAVITDDLCIIRCAIPATALYINDIYESDYALDYTNNHIKDVTSETVGTSKARVIFTLGTADAEFALSDADSNEIDPVLVDGALRVYELPAGEYSYSCEKASYTTASDDIVVEQNDAMLGYKAVAIAALVLA